MTAPAAKPSPEAAMAACPACSRLIYWDKMLEDPDGKPGDGAEKPAH